MEVPISLNKNFVNKQNVRSFGNFVKLKVLKNEDPSSFPHLVFEDKQLVSRIGPEVSQLLSDLKRNLLHHSKDDFKKFFAEVKKPQSLEPLRKADIQDGCLDALSKIIPKNFFGGPNNQKVFKGIIQKLIFSMKRQHVMFSEMVDKWDYSSPLWKSMELNLSRKVLCNLLIWIIKYIISAIIALNFYVTTCKLDADENKLHYFWRSQWQSFYDKKISDMMFSKVLRRFEPYCSGKKCKKNYDLRERLKLKALRKDIPKLHLVLKPNNDCRPIVRYKSELQALSEKHKMKEKLNFFKILTGKPQKKIETQFSTIHQEWIKLGKPKLYFIKTDLSNAFGSINREKLMKMLCERHMAFQRTEKCLILKKKIAQHFKEMVAELRKPILVRAGNTVYEWTEGLVQGYKYSPALSELYYTCLDESYFAEHLNNQKSFLFRVVDDYLYITDSLEDAHLFLDALSKHRNVNYGKTIVNFDHDTIKSSEELTFLGYSYDTKTLQVSRASNVYVGQMCYKIAFTNALANMSKFLENRIGQSGIQINGHLFNLHRNTETLIWQHIFTTFCLSANKFCTILAVLCEQRDMRQYVSLYKKRVAVKLTNSMIETLIKNKPADYLFVYCINHFKFLSFKALYLCAKETPRCNNLIPLIKDEMMRSNCLFGKWRGHAARIDPNGELRQQAVKDVCRRLDLRVIVKQFDTLPSGFACYNRRELC